MTLLEFDTFDELARAVLAQVRHANLPCQVNESDDVMSRRYGYEVVDSTGVSTFYRIALTRLKTDPWAKTLADSEQRDRLTRALAAGEAPDGAAP